MSFLSLYILFSVVISISMIACFDFIRFSKTVKNFHLLNLQELSTSLAKFMLKVPNLMSGKIHDYFFTSIVVKTI